jgi:hypothetical protein
MLTTKDNCCETANRYCACIEFHLDENRSRGFNTSQLIDYTLEPNPECDYNKNAPPQKLALAFSTADVVILGGRLDYLTKYLRENNLSSVRCTKHEGGFDAEQTFVRAINITPIEK